MTTRRGSLLAVTLLCCGGLATQADAGVLQRGAALRWTNWSPTQGVTQMAVTGEPNNAPSIRTPTPVPIPAPRPLAAPTPPPPAPVPITPPPVVAAPVAAPASGIPLSLMTSSGNVQPEAQLPVLWTRWAYIPQVVTSPGPIASSASSVGMASPSISAPAMSAPIAPIYQADGYINFGSGAYPEASLLTTGGSLPWYDSPVVDTFFGGIPNADQQAQFTSTVLSRVEQTFQQSGVPVNLTTDPNVTAAHTLSVVSNSSYPANDQAVGIANMGEDGFSFLDKFNGASSLDQLEWVLAHNIAHELMHTFGVDHHDRTGSYLDAPSSPWSVMSDPNSVLSPDAVSDLLSRNFLSRGDTAGSSAELMGDPGAMITASPVPEPWTFSLWAVAIGAILGGRRLRRKAA